MFGTKVSKPRPCPALEPRERFPSGKDAGGCATGSATAQTIAVPDQSSATPFQFSCSDANSEPQAARRGNEAVEQGERLSGDIRHLRGVPVAPLPQGGVRGGHRDRELAAGAAGHRDPEAQLEDE